MKSENNNQPNKHRRLDLLNLLPPLKWLLKQRWFQFAVILPNLVIFILLLLAGLWGSPVGNRNILIMFVWILWWFLLISVLVPFFSRLWCTVCPFPFFGEWLQRKALTRVRVTQSSKNKSEQRNKFTYRVGNNEYFGLGRQWPKRLRNIWFQNVGFILLCTFSALFLTRPIVSFIVLGSLFLTATVMGLFFRNRTFCLYVCPVSGFLSLYSMASKFALRSRDVEVCNRIKQGEDFNFDEGIASCRLYCPTGMDASSYIALIAKGEYKKALEVMRDTTPFVGVLGRVCTHPCETECLRGKIDESLSICRLKRFVADHIGYDDMKPEEEFKPRYKEKIAVVGGGPAGLSCAYHLARKGYNTVVYEELPVAGGMLRVGIPSYRLPKNIVSKEIDYIENCGVKILTGKRVGKDIDFNQLRKEYQAIFIAVGAVESKMLRIEGENLTGVYKATDILRKINLGEKVQLGKRVVVVGGGDTAVDTARVALRLGCGEVRIIYRRNREQMPAISEEIHAAEEEGVKLNFLTAPVKFLGDDGRVTSVLCRRMRLDGVDESGRPKPIPIKGSEYAISAENVIVATGQYSDISFLPEELLISNEGAITTHPETMSTNIAGIFAGGDVVRGPDVLVEALAMGRKGALAIDRYLQDGQVPPISLYPSQKRVEQDLLVDGIVHREKRVSSQLLPIEERLGNFKEVEQPFTRSMAVNESKRCLNCGICGVCYRGSDKGWGCPWFQKTGGMERNNYCGLCMECVKTCPYDNVAIGFRPFFSDRQLKGYDEAWKAFIMLAIAVAYSFIYLGPWGFLKNWANVTESEQWLNFFRYAGGLWLLALVIIPALHGLLVWIGKKWAKAVNLSYKSVFLALSYSFVPFGLFIWITFSLPLMFINGSYILMTASDPMGWGWNLLGSANLEWRPLIPEWMPLIQLILITTGLIFTLRVGWQNAKEVYLEKGKAFRGFIPLGILFGFLAILFYRLYAG